MMTTTRPAAHTRPTPTRPQVDVAAFFRALGEQIEAAWDATGRDVAAFSGIATEALAAARPSDHVSFMDILSWVLGSSDLPAQADLESKFSEPPITLFVSKSKLFHVSALHWIDGTTSIHQHAFSGAFHVLHGSSIQGEYRFAPTKRFGAHLMKGELTLRNVELLEKGATRPILSGDGLIHSLFHLDRPSVTIVVRTIRDEPAQPQLDYAPPGLAFDPYYKPHVAIRSAQLLRMLDRIGHEELVPRAIALVARSEPVTAYLVIDEMFRCLKKEERFGPFLAACRPHHPELVDTLGPVYAQRRREYKILARRAKVHSPEHRFLLALLMNVRRRSEVLALVEARYPGSSATARIARWVRELAAAGQPGDGLGLDLGEAELAVFELALEGLSLEAIAARLRQEYDEADVAAQMPMVAALCRAFETSVLFAPLFA